MLRGCGESSRLLSDDAEPRHPALQRRRLHAEAFRGPAGTADAPVRAFEHGADVILLQLMEGYCCLASLRRQWPLSRSRRPHGELTAGCHDERAFDDVAQFADVAGPWVALQLAQAVLRNRVD